MKIKVQFKSKQLTGIVKKKQTIKFDNLGAFLIRKRVIYFI